MSQSVQAHSKQPKPIIGALVGMGPNSTSVFYDKVMDFARTKLNARFDADFPAMHLYSLPTPFKPGQAIDEPAMKAALAQGIQALSTDALGVDFIAIPCNTVHPYLDELKNISELPILDMVEITLDALKPSDHRVALLMTEQLSQTQLYQQRLIKRGKQVINEAWLQELVNDLLLCLKLKKSQQQIKSLWDNIINQLIETQCDALVIACTDITVCLDQFESKIPSYDSTTQLAEYCIDYYQQLRHRETHQ